MWRVLWEQRALLAAQIAKLDAQIPEPGRTDADALPLGTTLPGIEAGAAANLIAESGVQMDQCPSAQPWASGAGRCPGPQARAGQRLSSTPRTGNAWWRRRLCQAAWAASPPKATYLAARWRRLAARKGQDRARIAVGPRLRGRGYHRLKTQRPDGELGADSVDRLQADLLQRYGLKRLEQLRVQVTVQNQEHVSRLPTETAFFEGEPLNPAARGHDPSAAGFFLQCSECSRTSESRLELTGVHPGVLQRGNPLNEALEILESWQL